MIDQFKVRDFRNKSWFMVDDEYLNGYAKLCGWQATLVYLSLCRHADNEQTSFPSIRLIGEEQDISESTVKRGIRTLKDWKIIAVEENRMPNGSKTTNTYILLDKSEWVRKPKSTTGHTDPTPPSPQTPHIKDTHTKDIIKTKATLVFDKPPRIGGMGSMKDIILKFKIPEKKTSGATHQWQDRAVQVWEKLKIKGKPDSSWFKEFRDNPALCERAYSFLVDACNVSDPKKYFYWKLNELKKSIKK